MKRLCNRHVFAWSLFALLLAGLAWALYVWLPPEPRWTLRGPFPLFDITPDGKKCITCTVDGVDVLNLNTNLKDVMAAHGMPVRVGPVQYWDIATGEQIKSVLGDRGPIWQVGFSSDRKQLAAVGPVAADPRRTELRWIDLAAGREQRAAFMRPAATWQPWISPSGTLLLLQDWNDPPPGIYLYDTASLRLLAHVKDPRGWRLPWKWSPAGDALHVYASDANGDATLRCIGVDGETTIPLKGAGEWQASSPDGKTLLTWSPEMDGTMQLWDLPAGTRRSAVPGGPLHSSCDPAFAPDGRTLLLPVVEEGSAHLGLWDLDGAKWLVKLPLAVLDAPFFLRQNAVILQESDQRITCYQLRPFAMLWQYDDKMMRAVDFPADVERVVVVSLGAESGADPQRRLVMSAPAGGDRLLVLDPDTGKPTLDVALERQATQSWRAHGTNLILISVKETPFERGMLRAFIEDHLLSLFIPIPDRGDDVSTMVRAFDIATGTERCRFNLAHAEIDAEVLTPDGQTLVLYQAAAVGHDAAVLCFDLPPRRPWRWILGIPSALGGTLLLVRFGLRRLRRRRSRSRLPGGTDSDAGGSPGSAA